MFDLTRQEKIILIFLSLTFVSGLGISAYKKTQKRLELDVRPYEMAALQDADKFIAQQRFININSFEIDELTRLAGVGEKLAERIVEYHKLHGPFKSKEDLMQVEGIGGKKFEKIKDLIILE
ncbi:MAG: helix-hairpin-helix domain-containing protein [Candidatus Omnitrophica bacterium]|nr:helix-hairpin-helix domain-containing protein [Candidatus Omnitrophota bacterium]